MRGLALTFALAALGTALVGCERNSSPMDESTVADSSVETPAQATKQEGAGSAKETDAALIAQPASMPATAARANDAARASYAAQLREAHSLADRAQSPLERERAVASLLEASELSGPLGATALVELRQSLLQHAARLELAGGREEAALTLTRRGLQLDGPPTVTVASLHIVRADALAAMGKTDDARSALLDALSINQQLLDQELQDP